MIRKKKSKQETQPSQGLRVLFADDEPSLQELMRIELPRLGHEVTVCPDGVTAVLALERNSYDAVLLDLDMPGLTGIEVLKKAKGYFQRIVQKYPESNMVDAAKTQLEKLGG